MTRLKQWIGWTSWLIVAMWLYGFAWSDVDDVLGFALPTAFYLWLDDLIGPLSQEGFEDLVTWSTSALAVAVLHLIVLMVYACVKRATKPLAANWLGAWRKASAAAGWLCWLLVCTSNLLACGETVYRARNGRFPDYAGQEFTLLFGGVLFVGALHFAVLRLVRGRQS